MSAEVIDLDDYRGGWVVCREQCRVCGHKCVGVVHEDADPDRLQCAGCLQMTSAITYYIQGTEDDFTETPRLEECLSG